MDQQAARGLTTPPQRQQDVQTDWRRAAVTIALLAGLCVGLLAMPAPEGLSVAGQRVLAVAAVAIGLWSSDALPMGVTGMLVVVLLVLLGGVPTLREALMGFAHPVAYFLMGVLTIGLAVLKSGLAERVARFFLQRSRGKPRALYVEMLLTGGITPITAAALIGGMSWTRWLVLMCVPYYVLLVTASGLIYGLYRRGFGTMLSVPAAEAQEALSGKEMRTAIITIGASLLWLTDAVHHWNPAIPALLAWVCLLSPGIGVLSWSDFERQLGWANLFVLASSLSLAQALMSSGAADWLADWLVRGTPGSAQQPLLIVAMLLAAAPIRLLIPNITGFLAITIPIAMSVGSTTGLNPVVCGLLMMIAGDAVLYYPAQSASSLVVSQRGHLSGPEIFRFGLWMTVVAYLVVLVVALPYWAAVGEPLVIGPGE